MGTFTPKSRQAVVKETALLGQYIKSCKQHQTTTKDRTNKNNIRRGRQIPGNPSFYSYLSLCLFWCQLLFKATIQPQNTNGYCNKMDNTKVPRAVAAGRKNTRGAKSYGLFIGSKHQKILCEQSQQYMEIIHRRNPANKLGKVGKKCQKLFGGYWLKAPKQDWSNIISVFFEDFFGDSADWLAEILS